MTKPNADYYHHPHDLLYRTKSAVSLKQRAETQKERTLHSRIWHVSVVAQAVTDKHIEGMFDTPSLSTPDHAH